MFKPFLSYMEEYEKKTYNFRVKIANVDINDEFMDRIEHALDRYELVDIGKITRLPIRTIDLDFPTIRAPDIVQFNVSLKYPCIDVQVKDTIGYQGRIPLQYIVVIPLSMVDDEENIAQDEIKNPQALVGEKRIDELKKLKTRKYKFSNDSVGDQKANTTNELKIGKFGPVSGKRKNG